MIYQRQILRNIFFLRMKGLSLPALLLCNLFVRAQQAYFSSKPPPGIMKATTGEDFTFNWSLTLQKNDSLVLMSLEYSKTEQFPETSTEKIAYILKDSLSIVNAFKGKVSVTRTGSLTLHNVSVEQRGFYKCSVSLQQKTRTVSIKRQLLVGVYPVIHPSPPSKITKLEDEHVDISCEASGSPVPNVSWYKNSQHGWKKLSGRRLQLKKLKLSDSGLYKCVAMNFMGSHKKKVKMVVYERPTVTSFFHSTALDDTVYECEAITLTCEARPNSSPVKNIYIYHGSRLVHRSVDSETVKLSDKTKLILAGGRRNGQLKITEVHKEHEGIYYCVAENEHGRGYNKTINLKVFAAPKNCERKRTLQTTAILQRRNDTWETMHQTPTDYPSASVAKTTGAKAVKAHSSSQIIKCSHVLAIAMLIWHLLVVCLLS